MNHGTTKDLHRIEGKINDNSIGMAKHLSHQEVVSFWFHELRPAQWFRVDQKIDQHITDRFEGLVDDAFHGRLFSLSLIHI